MESPAVVARRLSDMRELIGEGEGDGRRPPAVPPVEPGTAIPSPGRMKRHWPFGKFPMLLDDGEPIIETTPIIEYLDAHYPGENRWIPPGEMEQRVRFLDRFFDLHVMENMSKISTDPLRPDGARDEFGVQKARDNLNIAYDWIEGQLGDPWGVGEKFTLADCAAAPSLFYADWVEPIGDTRPQLAAYRARLLAHPAVARAVDEGRPYRHYFPRGAPDRD